MEQSPSHIFFKIHFNIILLSMPVSPKWGLGFLTRSLHAFLISLILNICYNFLTVGFLATGDEFASGNYGLKDQVDVLRWVRRNIHNFSGNPNSVTLFGAGAGAASVHYHMLSVLSHGE
jgi:carboxylesterase 2